MKTLKDYKKKRRFNRTPEPGPVPKRSASGRMFVVQKHRARNLHYDFRLEVDGVLKSWAVPKGPSLDPAVKRLAMAVEDHPVDYADFEGVIPEGEYGGGTVMVWDNGTFEPDAQTPDVADAIEKGELKFTLHGTKLNGSWVLVNTRDRQWLLIKHRDEFASRDSLADTEPLSVLSGRSLAEIASDEGGDVTKAATGDPSTLPSKRSSRKQTSTSRRKSATQPAKSTKRKKSDIKLPGNAKLSPMPSAVAPMLAKLVDAPFSSDEWVFETKWDGVRAICFLNNGKYRFISRNNNEMTSSYPELSGIAEVISADQAILDGEIVALDKKGIPRFQLLQPRFGLKKSPATIKDHTIAYMIFDLLYYNGYDLTRCDLLSRKDLLQKIIKRSNAVKYSDHIAGRGEDLFEHAEKLGLEGLIAKRSDSQYVHGRSSQWLKIKTTKRQEVVIAGYTEPRKSRAHFGALILGLYRKGKLTYVGHVGTGFNHRSLKQIFELMQPLKRKLSPFVSVPKTNEPVQWLRPELVAEVKFSEWTDDLSMRHPVFIGLRDDKKAKDSIFEAELKTRVVVDRKTSRAKPGKDNSVKVTRKEIDLKAVEAKAAFAGELKGNLRLKVPGGTVSLTNLDKIYWPDEGISKGDLIRYYYELAPVILPFLKDRPIILKRYPDGIKGQSFHQHSLKDPPDFVKTYDRKSDDGVVTHVICNNVASLLYVANLGSISLHAWSARMTTPQKPDWILFDLDPGDATLKEVQETALHLKGLLDTLGLVAYPKTSGSKGLHVYVPIKAMHTHEQIVQFATMIAHMAATERPDLIAVERRVGKRKKGRVYLDYLQNGFGKSLAAPYSVRARPGATVSTPLLWKEVKSSKLRVESFTIRNLARRLKSRGDLFSDVLREKQSLTGAIHKLELLLS